MGFPSNKDKLEILFIKSLLNFVVKVVWDMTPIAMNICHIAKAIKLSLYELEHYIKHAPPLKIIICH